MGIPAIQNWTVKHESVVMLHMAGHSNKSIAEEVNFTPERVSQILHDPHARELIERHLRSMRKRMEEDINDRLIVLADESSRRIQETLEAEFVLGSKPKQHQDNVAVQVLKGTGFFSRDIGDAAGEKEAPLTRALATRLVDALEKSNEAEQIQEAQEGVDYDIVEDDD